MLLIKHNECMCASQKVLTLKQNAKKMRMIQINPVRRFQCQRFNEEMCTGMPKDQRGQDFI